VSLRYTESMPLSRFIFEPNWTPVIGTYIFPLRVLGVPDRPTDPNDYLEVVKVISVVGTDIAITRGGGLFARDQGQYSSQAAVDKLCSTLNLLLCEFATAGLVSQPATYADIRGGKLIGRYASIVGGGGSFGDRTWGPFALLSAEPRDLSAPYRPGPNHHWVPNFWWLPFQNSEVLDEVEPLTNALVLNRASSGIPVLIPAAASHAWRHNFPETIITAWIVAEQLLFREWTTHIDSISDSKRKRRLMDTRTYTASVQAELLRSVGILEEEAYQHVQAARKVRNDLAHRGLATFEGASQCLDAMRAMIRRTGANPDKLPNFGLLGGGRATPAAEVEPEFAFD
jgi:hypothetical protein